MDGPASCDRMGYKVPRPAGKALTGFLLYLPPEADLTRKLSDKTLWGMNGLCAVHSPLWITPLAYLANIC